MPSFGNNQLPEPMSKPEPPSESNESYANPYLGHGFIKDTFAELLKKPDPARLVEKQAKKEETKPQKNNSFSISRRNLKKELEKTYDPYISIDKSERVSMEAEIKSKREKEVTDKEAGKFLKELKKEGPTKRVRFFDKFWKKLKDRNL